MLDAMFFSVRVGTSSQKSNLAVKIARTAGRRFGFPLQWHDNTRRQANELKIDTDHEMVYEIHQSQNVK